MQVKLVFPGSSSLGELTCRLCNGLVNCPIELCVCRLIVCSKCLTDNIEQVASLKCPVCNQNIDEFESVRESVRSVPSLVTRVLDELPIVCVLCSAHTRLARYRDHIQSKCKQHVLKVTTVDEVLSKPLHSPLLPTEEMLHTQLTKRYMATSSEEH